MPQCKYSDKGYKRKGNGHVNGSPTTGVGARTECATGAVLLKNLAVFYFYVYNIHENANFKTMLYEIRTPVDCREPTTPVAVEGTTRTHHHWGKSDRFERSLPKGLWRLEGLKWIFTALQASKNHHRLSHYLLLRGNFCSFREIVRCYEWKVKVWIISNVLPFQTEPLMHLKQLIQCKLFSGLMEHFPLNKITIYLQNTTKEQKKRAKRRVKHNNKKAAIENLQSILNKLLNLVWRCCCPFAFDCARKRVMGWLITARSAHLQLNANTDRLGDVVLCPW